MTRRTTTCRPRRRRRCGRRRSISTCWTTSKRGLVRRADWLLESVYIPVVTRRYFLESTVQKIRLGSVGFKIGGFIHAFHTTPPPSRSHHLPHLDSPIGEQSIVGEAREKKLFVPYSRGSRTQSICTRTRGHCVAGDFRHPENKIYMPLPSPRSKPRSCNCTVVHHPHASCIQLPKPTHPEPEEKPNPKSAIHTPNPLTRSAPHLHCTPPFFLSRPAGSCSAGQPLGGERKKERKRPRRGCKYKPTGYAKAVLSTTYYSCALLPPLISRRHPMIAI